MTSWRTFDEIVTKVERIKGEKWNEFRDRYGDWGRDMVLWAGRRYGGMTLKTLGEKAGGMDYVAVALAVRRLEVQAKRNKSLRRLMTRLAKECKM